MSRESLAYSEVVRSPELANGSVQCALAVVRGSGRVTYEVTISWPIFSGKRMWLLTEGQRPPREQAPNPPAIQVSKGWTRMPKNPVKRWEHLKSDTPTLLMCFGGL